MSALDQEDIFGEDNRSLEEQKNWGREAGGILASDVFKEAVVRTELVFIKKWLDGKKDGLRERAAIHSLVEIQRQLDQIVNDGVVAEEALEQA